MVHVDSCVLTCFRRCFRPAGVSLAGRLAADAGGSTPQTSAISRRTSTVARHDAGGGPGMVMREDPGAAIDGRAGAASDLPLLILRARPAPDGRLNPRQTHNRPRRELLCGRLEGIDRGCSSAVRTWRFGGYYVRPAGELGRW